jgi:cytochrome c oxidase subunit 2
MSLFTKFLTLTLPIISTIISASAFASSDTGKSIWKAPKDISVNGHLIDWLFNYTTGLNVFFFFFVCLGLFGFSFLYSKKRHPKPYYTYGNKKIHIIIVTLIGIAVFLVIDLNITRISNNDFTKVILNYPDASKEEVIRIEVMAQQWMWKFRYAGADAVFNTTDDVVTTNDLRLPTGKKVLLQVLSKDVIHSIFLPNVRRKVDAIPGRITRMWFEIKEGQDGDYEIACAEMCGTAHYKMKADLKVYNQNDFSQWLNEAQNIAVAVNDPEDAQSFWGWKWIN